MCTRNLFVTTCIPRCISLIGRTKSSDFAKDILTFGIRELYDDCFVYIKLDYTQWAYIPMLALYMSPLQRAVIKPFRYK